MDNCQRGWPCEIQRCRRFLNAGWVRKLVEDGAFGLDFERWLRPFFLPMFTDVIYLAVYYLHCLN